MVVTSISEEKALHEMGLSATPEGWNILGVAIDNNERGALVQMPSKRFCIMHKTGGKRVDTMDAVTAFLKAFNELCKTVTDKVIAAIVTDPPHPECFDCKEATCENCTVKGCEE